MRNYRFIISDEYEANDIAKDLRVQLEINRFNDVNIAAAANRNEVIVQVPEANVGLEETVESFMKSYHASVILE